MIHEVNRKNNLSDKVENFVKQIYSLMGAGINLYMLIEEIFQMFGPLMGIPVMLVFSLACTLAENDYYFMQLPPIHLLSALSHIPTF